MEGTDGPRLDAMASSGITSLLEGNEVGPFRVMILDDGTQLVMKEEYYYGVLSSIVALNDPRNIFLVQPSPFLAIEQPPDQTYQRAQVGQDFPRI